MSCLLVAGYRMPPRNFCTLTKSASLIACSFLVRPILEPHTVPGLSYCPAQLASPGPRPQTAASRTVKHVLLIEVLGRIRMGSRTPMPVLAALTAGHIYLPRATRLAIDTLAVLAGADVLQFGYARLQEKAS